MLRIDINLIFTVVNVLILFLAVRIFLWKPIHKILEQRQTMVDQCLADAAQAKKEAESLALEHREQLDNIAQERASALEAAQAQAQMETSRILDAAQSEAQSIVLKAEQDAAKRKDQIMRQAQSEISGMVLAAAAKVSGAADDNSLYDEFLKKAGETHE